MSYQNQKMEKVEKRLRKFIKQATKKGASKQAVKALPKVVKQYIEVWKIARKDAIMKRMTDQEKAEFIETMHQIQRNRLETLKNMLAKQEDGKFFSLPESLALNWAINIIKEKYPYLNDEAKPGKEVSQCKA